jgi:hypothetical protein
LRWPKSTDGDDDDPPQIVINLDDIFKNDDSVKRNGKPQMTEEIKQQIITAFQDIMNKLIDDEPADKGDDDDNNKGNDDDNNKGNDDSDTEDKDCVEDSDYFDENEDIIFTQVVNPFTGCISYIHEYQKVPTVFPLIDQYGRSRSRQLVYDSVRKPFSDYFFIIIVFPFYLPLLHIL